MDNSNKQNPEKPWLFQPGKSGNPGGRPKKTEEQKLAEKNLIEAVRQFGPQAFEKMCEMIKNDKTPAVARVQLIQMVLEYAIGKPESSIKLTTSQQSIENAKSRIEEIVKGIKVAG